VAGLFTGCCHLPRTFQVHRKPRSTRSFSARYQKLSIREVMLLLLEKVTAGNKGRVLRAESSGPRCPRVMLPVAVLNRLMAACSRLGESERFLLTSGRQGFRG